MATKTIASDLRRNDNKRTLWTPYWMTSSQINYNNFGASTVAVLWSFPAAVYGNSVILVKNICIQVVTAFAGGTPSIDIGSGTLATDDVTAAGSVTVVDDDEYIPSADITEVSTGIYWAASGDWITAELLRTNAAPVLITPADTTVPCIYALGFASGTAGAARVHIEICEVPTL